MTDDAGQPDDYYHYRIFSEGSITRQKALKFVHDNKVNLEDAWGICWLNDNGFVQCVHFKEMTDEELSYINCPLEKRFLI
jgi:DNA-binding transcriptional MerR regulator